MSKLDSIYLARVEEFFSHKREQGLILSPKDWQLAQEWHKEGIPLSVVLRGIERSFEQADSSTKIRSLAYCEPEVERLWLEYRKLMEGASIESHDEYDIFPPCPSVLQELKNCLENCINESHQPVLIDKLKQIDICLQELIDKQLAGNWESLLREITDNLICCLGQAASPQEMEDYQTEAHNRLKGYATKMNTGAYRDTIKSLINEQLLEKYNLKPFSLYC